MNFVSEISLLPADQQVEKYNQLVRRQPRWFRQTLTSKYYQYPVHEPQREGDVPTNAVLTSSSPVVPDTFLVEIKETCWLIPGLLGRILSYVFSSLLAISCLCFWSSLAISCLHS
jgi:hypothetical protein